MRALRAACAAWRPAAPRPARGLRWVGTQTPLWRSRHGALARASEAAAALRVANRAALPPPGAEDGGAAALAQEAHAAALKQEAVACRSLAWQIRDLPRSPAVLKAANAPCGEASRTLLQAFAAAGLAEPVGLLLEMGVRTNGKDAEGRTALHLAVEGNHEEVARQLLSLGRVHTDARDSSGRTPLHLAAELGHGGSGRLLMRFGADASAQDAAGRTPLEVAAASPDEKLGPWMKQFVEKRERTEAKVGKVRYIGQPEAVGMTAKLPHHIVAPKLVMTPVGYCPIGEDGKVIQLARGIRVSKRRKGPSAPKGIVNWYAPRG